MSKEIASIRGFRASDRDWRDVRLLIVGSGLSSGKCLGLLARAFTSRVDRMLKKFDLDHCGCINDEVFNLFINFDMGRITQGKLYQELNILRQKWEKGEFKNKQPKDYTGEFNTIEESKTNE